MSTTKGTQHLAGEIRSASDLDFYVDGVSCLAAVSGWSMYDIDM